MEVLVEPVHCFPVVSLELFHELLPRIGHVGWVSAGVSGPIALRAAVGDGRVEDQRLHPLRMIRGESRRHPAAERLRGKVDFIELQGVKKPQEIVHPILWLNHGDVNAVAHSSSIGQDDRKPVAFVRM